MKRHFYKNGKLDLDWLDKKAEQEARGFVKYLSSNQLRSFYSEFKRLEQIAYDDFDLILPHIKLIKAKANYKKVKRQRGWDKNFTFFLFELIDTIEDEKTLHNACMILEALVGFFPKNR